MSDWGIDMVNGFAPASAAAPPVFRLELLNGEASAYEAWRTGARELLAMSMELRKVQLAKQQAQAALEADPTDYNADMHLIAVQALKPVADAWLALQEKFAAALQHMANTVAPPPAPPAE